MKELKRINGNEFLKNIFITLIKRGKLSVSLDDIFHLEYYYLEVIDGDNNVLDNSKNNIMNFINGYKEYLYYDKESNIISISKEEDFLELLLFSSDSPDAKYKKAVKKLINGKKRKFYESIYSDTFFFKKML